MDPDLARFSGLSLGSGVALIGGLLVVAALFAAAEIAFLATGPLRARQMREEGRRSGRIVAHLLDRPGTLLSTILLVITVCLYFVEAIATYVFGRAWPLGEIISLPIMAVVILLFAEVTPVVIAARDPVRLAGIVSPLVQVAVWLLTPVTFGINLAAGALLRLVGVRTGAKPTVTEEDLKAMIRVSQKQGFLEEDRRRMLHGVFRLSDRTLNEIMVPRADMVTAEARATVAEVTALMAERRYSRVPIVEGATDEVLGIAHSKDLLPLMAAGRDEERVFPAQVRRATFVPETMKAQDLLRQQQQERRQMAIVVDESGSTQGLVTAEDILEELVGAISDEREAPAQEITQIGANEYIVSANVPIHELSERLGRKLPEEGYDTVGGLVYALAGHIPQEGETFDLDDLHVRVEQVEGRRVRRVRLTVRASRGEEE